MGVPAGFELTQNTQPYYRSTYVFVTRRAEGLQLSSLDDPRLRRLRIGVHVIGDDYVNVPAAQALAERGVIGNVRGFSIYGDYSKPDPPRDLIDAVARGEIDAAIAWGPLAGFFATREPVALAIAPLAGREDPRLPMRFGIAMGVRHGDDRLQALLEGVLERRRGEIAQLLARYGVPVIAAQPAPLADVSARPVP
jgi:ABC-type amino acid transport substrate-binding protein